LARDARRCQATTKAGARCRAWACWDDPLGRCRSHARPTRQRPYRSEVVPHRPNRTRYVPCNCPAYAWPHRPGSGLCRWPDPPQYRSTIRPGTKGDLVRDPWGRAIASQRPIGIRFHGFRYKAPTAKPFASARGWLDRPAPESSAACRAERWPWFT